MKKTILLPVLLFFFMGQIAFAQDAYEPNNEFPNAAPITCGNTYNALIQSLGDVDWFRVEMATAGYLTAKVNNVPSPLDLNLEIHRLINGQAQFIADDDDDNAGSGQALTATGYVEAGTYLVFIEEEDGDGTSPAQYTLEIECNSDLQEINQTYLLASSIPTDTCFSALIFGENDNFASPEDGDDDQDWYRVEILETGILEVFITSVPSILDLNLEILEDTGSTPKRVADDDDDNSGGGQDLMSVAYLNPGTYYIHIEDEDHDRTSDDPYDFCIAFTPNKNEVNQTFELASPIPLDTCFNENLYGENENYETSEDGDDDQDWYLITADSTCFLRIELTEVPSVLDLNMTLFQLENNQLVLVANDGDDNAGGGQNLFIETVLEPGGYYIHIEDEDHDRTAKESYKICVNCDFDSGISTINPSPFIVFPNPGNGVFRLEGLIGNTDYQVYDLQGRLQSEGSINESKIDLTRLNAGMYILNLIWDAKKVFQKIIIE